MVFITAMSHDAIDACKGKLESLVACYRAIEHVELDWLENVSIEKVVRGSQHVPPSTTGTHIYAGTLYQVCTLYCYLRTPHVHDRGNKLYNFSKSNTFRVDCVVADEAGQIALASLSLVLRSLSAIGRIVVAGDSEQLAPILRGRYPRLKAVSLFGSVLDSVMFSNTGGGAGGTNPLSQSRLHGGSEAAVIQLTENFR